MVNTVMRDERLPYLKIAVKEVPLETFAKIEVGPYYGDTRVWQQVIDK